MLVVIIAFPQEGEAKHWIHVDSDAPKSEKTALLIMNGFGGVAQRMQGKIVLVELVLHADDVDAFCQRGNSVLWILTHKAVLHGEVQLLHGVAAIRTYRDGGGRIGASGAGRRQ